MAGVKWIKIVTDIFDDEKTLLIEHMPSPDSIIVIWFKLLCLAGKQNSNGVIMLNDRVPYTDEMLATVFRRDVNTVRMALNVFEQFDMIRIVDGVITIPNWEKHQNIEGLDKIREQTNKRVAAYRQRQKLLAEGANSNAACNVTVTQSNATEEDKEEDKEKKKKKSVKEDTHTLFKHLIPDYTMTDDLKAKLAEWITYKVERKETYKETGLKSLLRKVENKAQMHGDQAIIDLIDECMAAGWKGIIFDRLTGNKPQYNAYQRPASQKPTKAEELNDFYNMAASWAESE